MALSIELILRHQASTGAYLAAPGYGTYDYCWMRDGAFVASAMDAYGQHESAAAFHRWAAQTIERYAHKVDRLETDLETALRGTGDPLRPLDDRYVLHTRFTVDGDEGVGEWGNFQLDGYGFWLTSVVRHVKVTGSDPAPYENAIDLVRRYLKITWEMPCFDCWEEYPTHRHATTWAAVARGLADSGELLGEELTDRASELVTQRLLHDSTANGAIRKFMSDPTSESDGAPASEGSAVAGNEGIGRARDDDAIDGGVLLVLGDFGPLPPSHHVVRGTLDQVENTLVVDGGVHRYLEDEYYGGGLWIVLAGALARIQGGYDTARANEILDWIEKHADANGHLGEQVDSALRHPERRDPWVTRWGPPASPLLWSHAMYLLAAAALEPVSRLNREDC